MRRNSFARQVLTAVARATPATAPTRESASANRGTASQLITALARATPAFAPGSRHPLGDQPEASPEPGLEESPSGSFFPEAPPTVDTWVVIDPHQPPPRRYQREPFRRRLAVASAGFAVPVLLLVGVVIGRHTGIGAGPTPINDSPGSQPTATVTVTPTPTATSTPSLTATVSPLMVALILANKSADATGLLPPATCRQASSALVTCTAPAPGITGVIFQTYPNQKALYTAYMAKVASLNTGHQFKQNFRDCESQVTYGEISWNHQFQHTSKYTVAQMITGNVTDDQAAGRVFCNYSQGQEYMVWTQNDGHLLGYVAGPLHIDVWNWWVAVHHNIGLGGSPGKPGRADGDGTGDSVRREVRRRLRSGGWAGIREQGDRRGEGVQEVLPAAGPSSPSQKNPATGTWRQRPPAARRRGQARRTCARRGRCR